MNSLMAAAVRRFVLFASTMLVVVHTVCGDEQAEAPALPEFHRVYIPAEQLQKGTWSEGYLPIERNEFERLLESVSLAQRGAPGARGAHLAQVQWAAQLVGDDLLVGKVSLELERMGETPSLLPLAPWTPAVGRGTWRDQSRPARMGTGPDGVFGVLVEGTALDLDWSLRGQRTASGAVAFHFELPTCPVNRLVVDLPAELELLVETGVVSKGAGPNAKLARWTIDLGGHHDVTLKVVSDAAARERRPLTLLRQALTYDFSQRGIHVAAQLKLDIHGEPIRRLAIDLDPSLILVAARYGEQPIPWSATIDVETRVSHVVLQLPEPITGTGRVVQLSAITPLITGKRFRLPGLQAESVSWQEGTAMLLIPDSLVAEQFAFDGCRQSQSAARPAPQTGDAIEVQYYRPAATIDVLLAQPQSQLTIGTGALVEVGASEISSQLGMTVGVPWGQRRELELSINPGWTVDEVTHAVSNRAVEWEVDDAEGAPELKIRLEDPVSPQSPARLVVRGHRGLPAANSFEAAQFKMLDFRASQVGNRLISVRASEGTQLRWSGAVDLQRLDPLELGANQLELFPRTPNGLLFADDAVFAQSVVAIDRRKLSFTADIRIDAAVQRDVLTETYTIACLPESTHAERLLVRLSQARPGALEWKLAGGNSGQFSARRISAGEQVQAGLSPGGEAWELSLRLSRPGPFELRAVRSVAFDGETHLALAAVADAATQHGTLTIRALGESGVNIKNRRLTSVPAELLDPSRYQTTRAAFHYQPTSDDVGAEPAVSLEPAPPTQAESGAWAWSGELNSRYSTDRAVHRATYRVQTAGRERINVQLAHDASLQDVWVNRERFAVSSTSSGSDRFTVELPPGERLATITIWFATPDALPSLSSTRAPPFPSLDIPVLTRHWRVALPREYDLMESDSYVPSDSEAVWSWSQRLFGIIARAPSTTRFNPLSASSWRGLLDPQWEAKHAALSGEEFLGNFGALMSESLSGDAESQLTWGQLVALCADLEAKARRDLLVDADALANAGLSPDSRVRFQAGDTDRDRAVELLEQFNLALLVHPGLIAIVSRAEMTHGNPQITACDSDFIYTISPSPMLERLTCATAEGTSLRYVSAANWRAGRTVAPAIAWSAPELRGSDAYEPLLWNAYSFHFDGDRLPHVRIAHLAAITSLAWAVLLATAALGAWLRPPAIYLVGCAAISAALAMWLPVAYAPVASAVFLAAMACIVARSVRVAPLGERSSTVLAQSRSSRVRTAALESSVMLLFIAALMSIQGLATAQPISDEKTPPEKSTQSSVAPLQPRDSNHAPKQSASGYQVLVPADAPGQVVDKSYYIPDEFYKRLHRMAASASGQPRGWLVTRASYQAALVRDPVSKTLGIPQLKASFELRVFQSAAQIGLPFPQETAATTITSARLDGRAVMVRWNDEGSELLAPALAPGDYRLEIDFQPVPQSDATLAGISMPIPAMANATLSLTLPMDAPSLELPTARGRIRTEKDRGELTAQLGAADRLVVRWPAGVGAQAATPTIDVDELIWMRVRPGTTILEAKFKYRVLEGKLRQIQLLVDPRLRMLPSNNPRSPIAAVRSTPGDPQRIELELTRSVEDQVVVDVSFLLTGASGVGNLRLPRLESSGARATKRWLAVNVDPALEYRDQLGEDSDTLPINEFSGAWGLTEMRPQAVYRIPRGEAMWVLATQPIEPRTSVDEVLAASVGKNSTMFALSANISIEQGYLFQLLVQVPKGTKVDRVSLVEGESQRVSRWSLDADGRLTVFLTTPLTGRHLLSVRGRVDVESQEPVVVPRVGLLNMPGNRRELQIYRQSELLVTAELTPGLTSIEPTPIELSDDFGFLTAAYQAVDRNTELRLIKTPNAAQAKAVLATALEHSADLWTAEMICRLEVSGGVVDVLQFEIPPQWSEPFHIEPSLRWKIVPIPGEARRQLLVYPAKPISDSFQLKIRGRVAFSPGDRLRVPEILPLHVQEVERYVVVPRTLDRQQIAWETIGLVPAELPRELAAAARGNGATAVYQVAGEHYQAAIKAVRRASDIAQIKLADIHLAFSGDGFFRAVAQFNLSASGRDHCVIELPPSCQVVHADLDGLPVQLTKTDEQHWRVVLGRHQLPQRLEVVYRGSLDGNVTRRHLQAPRLVDFDLATTLWTIDSPSEYLGTMAELPTAAIDPATQMLTRLDSISSLAQLPPEAIAESLPEELVRWYRPWKKRYQEARTSLAGEMLAPSPGRNPTGEDAAAVGFDRQMAATDSRVGAASTTNRSPETSGSDSQRLLESDRNVTRSYYRTSGSSTELAVRSMRHESPTLLGRVLAGGVFLAIGVALMLGLRHRPLPQFAPSTLMAVVGILWWLFLSPSLAGLVLLVAAIGLAWRLRNQPARWAIAR